MAGEAAASKSVQVNQIKLSVGLKDIDTIKVVDTDFVLQLKGGKKIVIRDGALKAMLDPELMIQFSDTGLKASSMLKMIGPVVPDAASAYTTKDVASPTTEEAAVKNVPATKNPELGGGNASPAVDAASPTVAPSNDVLLVNDKLQRLEALVEKQIEQIDALRSRLESVAELPALQTSIAPAAASSGFLSGISPAWGALGALGAVGGVVGGGESTPSMTKEDLKTGLLSYIPPDALGLSLVQDTGASSTDGHTSNGTFQVSYLAQGNSWQYSVNYDPNNTDAAAWTDVSSGSKFVVPEGSYAQGNIAIRQKNAFGIVSKVTVNDTALVVDSTKPTAPVYEFTDDMVGGSDKDGITQTYTIKVNNLDTRPGTYAQYTIGRDADADGQIDWYGMAIKGNGTATITMDANVDAGKFRIRQTDSAGNRSTDSATNDKAWIFVKPVQALLVEDTGNSDMEASPTAEVTFNDQVTSNPELEITGLVAGSLYQYTLDAGIIWKQFFGPSEGSYFITLDNNSYYAANSIKIQQILSPSSKSPITTYIIDYPITIDNTVGGFDKSSPTLTNTTSDLVPSSRPLEGYSRHQDNNVIELKFDTKVGDRGEIVRYRRTGSTVWTSSNVLAPGAMSVSLTGLSLDAGANNFEFQRVDKAGNTSAIYKYVAYYDNKAPEYELKILTKRFDGGTSNSFYSTNKTQTIEFSLGKSKSDGDRIVVKTYGTEEWQDITQSTNLTNNGNGKYTWTATLKSDSKSNVFDTVEIAIVDQAGNMSSIQTIYYLEMAKDFTQGELASYWWAVAPVNPSSTASTPMAKAQWSLAMDAQFTRKMDTSLDYDNYITYLNYLEDTTNPIYKNANKNPNKNVLLDSFDQVTGTDIVSNAEFSNEKGVSIFGTFEIRRDKNGDIIVPTFYLDNDRTDGYDVPGDKLVSGEKGVTINYSYSKDGKTGSFEINFAQKPTVLDPNDPNGIATVVDLTKTWLKPSDETTAGSGVHKITMAYDDPKTPTVVETEVVASRLFLVSSGTAKSGEASNYSVQDPITKNVFVYYYGDPDGADKFDDKGNFVRPGGVGIWYGYTQTPVLDPVTKLPVLDPVTNLPTMKMVNASNADGVAYAGGSNFNYYKSTTIPTNPTSSDMYSQYMSNIQAKVFEFSATLMTDKGTSPATASNLASNHTKTNSNTSRLISTEEMLALYAANFQSDGTVGDIAPMSHDTQTVNDNLKKAPDIITYNPSTDVHVPQGWDFVSASTSDGASSSYVTAGGGFSFSQSALLVSLRDGTLFDYNIGNGAVRIVAVL